MPKEGTAPVRSGEVGGPAALHSSGRGSSSNAADVISQSLPTRELNLMNVMETEDLVDRILLRLPPDDPWGLAGASLVCKSWFNLISDRSFRRRYCALHKTPPMLGFLHNWTATAPSGWSNVARFVPTAGSCTRNPERPDSFVLDCRHGRVLLGYLDECGEFPDEPVVLAVWDPMTDSCTELREPNVHWDEHWASVICAVPGCKHDDCCSGPFLVVFVGLHRNLEAANGYVFDADAYIYSSETCEWSSTASLHVGTAHRFKTMSRVLVGGNLNFLFAKDGALGIINYDLVQHSLSMSDMPNVDFPSRPLLMAMEDSALGPAYLDKLSLYMWSRGAAAWKQSRVIDLSMSLPVEDLVISPKLVGSVEDSDIIFVITSFGTYTINLRSLTSRMVSRKPYICKEQRLLEFLYPYMSFNNPQGADKLQKEALKNHSYDAGSSFQAMAWAHQVPQPHLKLASEIIVLSDSDDDRIPEAKD